MDTNSTVTTIGNPKLGSPRVWKLNRIKLTTRRPKYWLLVTLCLLAFYLTSQNALASSWYATTIYAAPPCMKNCGLTPWSSFAVGNEPYAYLYLTGPDGTLYEGWYKSGSGWQYTPIYSSASAGAGSASAVWAEPYTYVAHTDRDARLRLTINSPFGGWSTRLVDGSVHLNWYRIGTVWFGGKLYIFYTGNQPGTGSLLHCAIWDGAQFTYRVLDGNGGFGGVIANMGDPAPVVAPDGLRIYYIDIDHDTLREAYSKDGVNWQSYPLDGAGGLGGNTCIGEWHTAIVNDGAVNVFYQDECGNLLRTAQLSAGKNKKWSFGVAAPTVSLAPIAALVHANTIHVFYTDNGLADAYGTGPGTFQTVVLDGQGGIATGSDPQLVYGGIWTAVEVNNSPNAFYPCWHPDGPDIVNLIRWSFWQ